MFTTKCPLTSSNTILEYDSFILVLSFNILLFFGSIREQMKQMEEHVQKYGEHYPLKNFSKE